MNNQQAVRLKDIAETLGVSQSTVSRAMSGSGRVSSRTRQRVLRAVKQVGYTPNDVARSLRRRNAKTIGILVTDITNPFFSSVIKGAQTACRENGYSVLLANSDEDADIEAEALQLMLEKQVSGLILATTGDGQTQIDRYRALGIPVVFIDNMPDLDTPFDSVSIDNYRASHALTHRLIDKGYRELGIILGPLHQSTGNQRWKGFRDACSEEGIALRPEWIQQGDFRVEGGRRCMGEILSLPERPLAMVLSNNYLAYGAVDAIRSAGLRIPQDICVVAFDTDDISALTGPSITAMNQPAEEIGSQAARIAIARLVRQQGDCCQNLILDPIFAEGCSW